LPVAESVELATILLTDLVGSTRLANSVGPVRADDLREEHFELLRDAIVSSGGREVKNTGDGLMIAFSSASAGVKCAVAMQQLFERRYRDAEQALHVRVGLAAGESTVKDGDYFGAPSIEAARLCAQAPADGILISGMAKALAGRCEGVEFSSVGELELKGFPDPVEAFSVAWEPLAQEGGEPSGRWPLPAVLRSVPPVQYVGRVGERAALEEGMKLARSRQRQVVLLSGEPGIGKTRLASYAAHDAHAEGFAVAWGACTEELAVPYEPWIGVCSQLVEHAPAELLARHLERHGGELSRVARNLASRGHEAPAPQSSDPETERYLLFNAVAGLLAEVAEVIPLCLVLDDLHWADAQSVALLKHLLRSTEQVALEVLITYRDSDLGKDHPLTAVLADLRSLQGVQRLALHGLGADEVAEIMTAVAGHELDPDGVELAGQIAAETDGNPFFVAEILRGLSESGALVFDEDAHRWSVDTSAAITLPESVREVIERRVERLGEQSLEALRLAAVIGREFDLELLAAVVEMDEGRLLDELEAAVAAALLAESSEEVGRFRFAHALVNQTLYDGLGATRRARMHQRVAEALEQLYGADPINHLGELALHWRLAAVSVDRAKTIDYALKAAQQALESLAPSEAKKLFENAVELSDSDSRERCEALLGLGTAQRQTGDPAHRETLLEASMVASALGNAELAARAALENNRGDPSVYGGIDEERLAAIDRAIELDDPPEAARRARLLALKALELEWDPDFARRQALADEAVLLARTTGEVRTLAEVLRTVLFACRSAETLEMRSELTEELLHCVPVLEDRALDYWAANCELYVSLEKGQIPRAAAALGRMQDASEELGQPTLRWFATWHTASWQLVRDDLEIAEGTLERAFQIGQEAGEPNAVLVYGGQLAALRSSQGRSDEIIAMMEGSVEMWPGLAAFRAGLAHQLCILDRPAEAAQILDEAARDGFEHVAPGVGKAFTLGEYAVAAAETSNITAATILYELMKPWSGQVISTAVISGTHARAYLGQLASCLGRHEEADSHFAFACEFLESNGLLVRAAENHLVWAEALAARGERRSAREHAARALQLSREHGYGLVESRAAALVETESAAGA
jgi:class 3 adenylate cyclase